MGSGMVCAQCGLMQLPGSKCKFLPDLVSVEQRSKSDQAMSESRMAVSQAIRYANTRAPIQPA